MNDTADHAIQPPDSGQSQILAGERVTFTGTLASMTHRQAQQIVAGHGGIATTSASKQTTMLVIGEEGWPLEPDGKPSLKLQQITAWQQEAVPVRIVKESEWLSTLGLNDRLDEVQREYTPAMLSQLLDVPVGAIRSWERAGLIRPVRRVYRLPYFNFQEVASARRLAELLAAGVPQQKIKDSLAKLDRVMSGIDRPLMQLELLVRDRRLLYRDDVGLVETASGQRLLEFDPPPTGESPPITAPLSEEATNFQAHWTADSWFAEACHHVEDNELPAAVEAFRLCLTDDPRHIDAQFQLAEVLYRLGNVEGALERYYVAVELDHKFLEAWTQIGCLHAEQGRPDAALEAFDVALDVHADYPDAHFHKAETLHQLARTGEALQEWRTYLNFDTRGPWADLARRRLEDAGPANA